MAPPPPPPSRSSGPLIAGIIAALVVVIAAIVVVVVVKKDKDDDSALDSTSARSTPTEAADDAPRRPDASPRARTKVAEFGADHPFAYSDDVTVAVTSVERFTPGKYDDVKDGDVAIKITIKVTNDSSSAIDLLSFPTLRAGKDGMECGSVYTDGTSRLGGQLLPDRAATGVYAFAVPASAGKDLSLSVDIDFDRGAAVFEGQLPD